MRLVERLKLYAIYAVKKGKIIQIGAPKTQMARPLSEFASKLNDAEWNKFEIQERAFRSSLPITLVFKTRYMCKGEITRWTKVMKFSNCIFVNAGEFQKTKANGEPWKKNMRKFAG